jgi:uncharacterized protein
LQLLDDAIVLSATDLNNFLACEHLTALDLQALRGHVARPVGRPAQAALLAKLGEEHEQAYLERLRADGHDVVKIERADDGVPRAEAYRAAASETERAMAARAKVIYQATFFDGTWVGHADFLRRVDERIDGCRWDWHYEVEDTKLARHTEPYFLLQLCNYSEHVARVQGAAPRMMYVVLGDGQRYGFRVDDFAAYYRSVRARFGEALAADAATYPLPVSHCGLCAWDADCSDRRRRDDHLSGVAGMMRLQTERLNAAGITTLAQLATASDDDCPDPMASSTFEKLRRQARLQDEQRRAIAAGEPNPCRYEIIADAIDHSRGFTLLPEPSPGDVFFDMEGDPYYDIRTGLEYLFGVYTADDSTFTPFWGCDRSGISDRLAEKKAFEQLIDFIMTRRDAFPGMHVYHYASYEKTALQKLSLRHATREDEVDIILREDLLVDLYRVVRQALVVGQPSYSIKKIEEYYGKRGDASGVKAGDDSILQFEAWLASRRSVGDRDDAILADIETYNRYDCESTYKLRQWLLELRAGAAAARGVEIPWYAGKPVDEEKKFDERRYVDLMKRLDARLPEDFDPTNEDPRFDAVRPFFLARHMLEYHWRELKPVYWQFHDRCATFLEDPEELRDDAEAIVGLEVVGQEKLDQSIAYRMRFPAQLHKLQPGTAIDPATKKPTADIVSIEDGDEFGYVTLKRGKKRQLLPMPTAITKLSVVDAGAVLDAIARFAETLLEEDGVSRYRAAFDVLLSRAPRLRGKLAGDRIQPDLVSEESVRSVVHALDDSYLFVQGPPGAGKTYIGARLIVELLRAGKRVGITSNSHKAINNLLDEVVDVGLERGVDYVGVRRASEKDADSQYDRGPIASCFEKIDPEKADLIAGTAWAFGPDAMDQCLDYLFIDEAGQMALPVAIAVSTAAKNVVLLGDPLQLPQVRHAQHPGNVGASVLEHLLTGDQATAGGPAVLRPVAPDRGILLTDSYRMHPDVCGFISELLYEGRLESAAGRDRQRVDSEGLSGSGLRYIAVPHRGNRQRSLEEARCIADEIELLLRGTVTETNGLTRPARPDDVIVVAPYNAHVQCIRRELERRGLAGVPVGTVDKFQGREAHVVFFATAASTPDEASRGLSFVFDRQRFNVAISRARAVAVMVGSPELRPRRCTSIDDVRVANGVCRFLELASASLTLRQAQGDSVAHVASAAVTG